MRASFDTIARIAAGQAGRVSFAQLVEAGVDRHRMARWCADGRLRRVHTGEFAVGHMAPAVMGDVWGAVLAYGEATRASHGSVGFLFGLVKSPPRYPEVTVRTTAGLWRPGMVIHRVHALDSKDTSCHLGLPITTIPQTLLDLAPRLSEKELTRACHEACVHRLPKPRTNIDSHLAFTWGDVFERSAQTVAELECQLRA